MSIKSRNLIVAGVAVSFLVWSVLACGPLTGGQAVTVVINSPASGATVTVGDAVSIDSTASADAGVGRVDLVINGAVVRSDAPVETAPSQFRVSQSWTAEGEGQVTLSVVAYDVTGKASTPAVITLQVVASAAGGATAVPGATAAPNPTEVPPVTTEAGCTLYASFQSDITIPDDTVLSPGSSAVKTWRIKNTGTCDWGAGFRLVFVSGDQMGGESQIAVPPTAAGSTADLSINITAPATPGTYRGNWRMQSDEGLAFGQTFYVQIVVPAPATNTPIPPTVTPVPTGVPTEDPTTVPTLFIPPVVVTLYPALLPYTESVYEQISIPSGAIGNATASCPSGSVVVSGGYAASNDVLVYTHSKNGNGWRAYAKNNAGSSKLLNVYATCLYNVSGASTTQVHDQVTAAAGGIGHPVIACPAGSVVTGGGWASKSDGSLWVYNSSKSGNGWQVYAKNSSGSGQLLNAYAICLSGADVSSEQIMESVSIAGGSTGNASPVCGSGEHVTGGGFASQDDLVMYNTSPYTTGTDQWRTYARNSGGSSRTMYGYAVCLSFQ